MKKRMKKFFVSLLACMMMLSSLTLTAAAEGEEYEMFLAYGGESSDGAWDLCFDSNTEIVQTTANAKVGDTVTIGVTLPTAATYTWYMAPVILAENVTDLTYTIDKVTMDGNDITDTIDLTIGEKEWWYEGTGTYTDTQAIRLKGGYNEWADKFIAESPKDFTTVEYTITLTGLTTGAPAAAGEEELSTDSYPAFIAFGGDFEADNDWGFQYYGDGAASNAGDIVATNGELKNGETTTLTLEFPSEVYYTWFTAPTFITDDTSAISANSTFEVKVLLDGEEIATDLSAGKACWAEGTGDYADTQAMRIGGGYNEWGDKYIAESPKGFTTLTFEITPTIYKASAAAGATVSDAEYPAFIAFGGDAEADNDWGFQYYGNSATSTGDVVATDGVLKSGETTTLTLEFPSEVHYTWFVAPTFVADDTSVISADSTFDVKVFIDGEEVATDLSAGKACWAEGTGEYADTQAMRIGGGYNEWGDKYLAESPAGFKTISFEITPTIYVTAATEEAGPQNEFDPNGTYHAYIGVQTPTWIFRNSWDDATYGKDSGCFDQMGFIDGEWLAQGGSFTDVEITGNGTYTVAVNGYDFSGDFDGAPILGTDGLFNLLFVSTDLPVNDEVVISNIVLKMDGKEITTQAEAFLDADSKEVQKVLLANIWNSDISALPYYAAPTESIEISFDVSGFANDAVVAETEEPTTDTAPEATEAPAADTQTSADAEESGSNTGVIIVIVVVVVAAAAIAAGVVVSKKKKGTK